jgi:hypothetical protein
MRDTNLGRRLPLKSRLLIGATGFAAVAMSTAAAADGTPAAAAPAADPAKWLPYADITAGIGSGFSAGQLDLFAPVWQDLDSLLFARGGLEEGGQDNSFWNFGLGYRTKIAPDWILGVYANYDRSKTDDQMMTHQWSGGAELMNEDWDFRVNGYLAPDDLHASGFHGLYIHDTTIAILQGEEGAYSGFDGEVGYRVFNTDNTDVRLFAGGFWFDHSGDAGSPLAGHNFDFHDIKGPKARAEVNMFSIDGLGAQSRLSLEGEVAHDSVRGTTGFVGATLRIALNDDSGPGAQALDELDRRMADPERRQDNVLTQTIAGKPEPVIIYNANIHSQPTNTLYYAQQQATTGIGSYANPTTIQDATARGPVNQFIVVTDKGGPVVATGAVVQTGETVVGGGETFKVRAVTGGPVFTHTFAPGSGTPTLTADSAADNALTVAGSNVVVSGLNFAGPFAAAIYGHNVTSVTIDSVNIDGTGGGVNGVVIDQDVSGNSTITIQNSSIANVSNDGVNVNNTFSDGGTTTENLHLDNTSVSNSGNDGVYVGSNVSGGSTANLNTELTSSSITGSSSTDVLMGATVAAGSTVNQNITIDPTTISGGTYGVQVNGTANGGTLNQYVGISDVDFSGQSKGALAVSASGSNGAVVTQTVNLTDVTITGSDVGINLGATATTGAHVSQYFALSQVSVTGAKYAGISITAHADGAGSVLHQYGTLADITASNAALGDGVYVYAESTNGGTTIGRLNVTDLTATGNKYDGLYVGVEASSSTANASVAAQYVSVTGSNLWGNRTGFEALAEGTGNATAAQNVFVGTTVFSDTAHSGTESDGALIEAFAFDEGSVQQSVYLANDTAQGAAGNGVEIDAASLYGGFAAQTVQVYGSATALSQITDNSGFGISVSADASNGGDIEQNIDVYYVNASHNTDGGLKDLVNSYGITAGYSLYYSHVSQNIIAFGDHFDRNGGDGVGVVNYATYGAGIDQFVYLGGSTATHNTGSGIHVNSQDVGASSLGYAPGTHLYSDVSVYNSTLDRNGVDGITIQSSVTMPDDPTKVFGDSYLEQHVVVSGVTAEGNHGNGFTDNASATGIYSLNLQYITLQNSNFNDNRGNGAAFTATQYFGPYSFGAVLQDVTITSAQFNNNAGDGIHAVADASGFQGRAEQYFSIFYSQADGNHGNGMSFYRHSHDGAYYPGFACNTVQGLTGGCGIIRQTVQIGYSDISGNRLNGIDLETRADNYGSVYAKSGRPAYTSSFFVEGSTIDANHGDGLHVYNYVGNHSYEYQYVVALNTTIDSNHGDGIGGLNNVTGNSQLIQKVVLYGISADTGASNNGGSGIDIDSQATAGGNISSLVVVGFAELDGNHGDGISVNGGADSGAGTASTSVAQYVDVISSDISGNHSYGIDLRARANNAYAVTYQYLSLTNSTVSANHNAGVHAFEIGYNASAADQSLYFNNDTITNNNGDGVYAVSISVSLASTQQNVLFGYKVAGTTNITGNHGDGIYVGTAAFSGAQAEQNVFVYDVNSSHNRNDGLGIGASANGYGFGSSYIYYSHVSQNVVAAYDTFDHNGGNGMSVSNVLYYGGAMNQLVEAIDVDMSHNHGAGFYSTTHLTSIRGNSFSFSTNISSDLYLIGDTIDHNLANGIDIRSYTNGAVYAPAFFGGYNYMEMHNQISGTTADNNGGSGLSVNTNTTGRYSLNAEYFTISGSTFDHNHGDGAAFTSTDNYGPGGFGDSYQHITISGSDFSSNAGNGLDLAAFASGNQGRAEQHVTVTGSTFDHNGGDGVQIYASAINGTYITGHPCDAVQGLPGGCAFVRQNVTIEDSIVSNNDNNGVNVGTYANNYGAIYGVSGRPHAPTVELYGDTVNDNGGRGLNVSNHVTGHSYLYQYVAAIDSSFNNNHSDGVYLASYVGGASTMLQRALLYSYHTGSSASGNGGNGFKSTIEALGGSYAHDVNLIEGVKLDHDGSFGFDGTVAYADGSSTGLQINAVYFNSINHNGDGAGLYSIGAGAQQISFLGGNDVIGNSFVGVYGEANFGAFQYIGVYTLGNTVHGNGTNYLFNSFGGSTQILN